MDNTILYVMMIVNALIMAILPFGFFLGLSSLLQVNSSDSRLFVTYILAALVFSYLTALGAFALVQRFSCGSVKNMKQVASNAALALGIQAGTLIVIYFLPFLRNIVSGLLPPDLDSNILDSVAYSYYSMWAALFGTAIGGTLSSVCSSDTGSSTASVGFDLTKVAQSYDSFQAASSSLGTTLGSSLPTLPTGA